MIICTKEYVSFCAFLFRVYSLPLLLNELTFFWHLNSTVFFLLLLVFIPTRECVFLELGFNLF